MVDRSDLSGRYSGPAADFKFYNELPLRTIRISSAFILSPSFCADLIALVGLVGSRSHGMELGPSRSCL